jgi:hypothetical protein
MGISAWIYVPLYLLFLVMPQWAHVFLRSIVSTFVAAVVTVAISERILGRKASITDSYSRVGRKLLSFIGALLLTALVMIPVMLIMGIGVSMLTGLTAILFRALHLPSSLQLVGVFLAMSACLGAAVLVVMVCLLFVPQAVLLEGTGAARSIGRSVGLIKGSFWKTLGILILVSIALFLLNILIAVVGGVVTAMLSGGIGTAGNLTSSIQAFQQFPVLAGIIDLLLQPFRMVVITLLYYDIRVRKEAYDTELMAEELAIEADSPGKEGRIG